MLSVPAVVLLLQGYGGTGGVYAHEAALSVRGLTGKTGWVVRGTVLDQELAPGGLWHRLRVEEVLWPLPRTGEPGAPEIGPTLRVFAHGPGVPEGATLDIGEDLVAGVELLPPADGPLSPFLRRLWQGFHPDRPGERPALASADGLIPVAGDPLRLEAVRKMVIAARDGAQPVDERRTLLLELTGNPLPALREEALRQLARADVGLPVADRGRAIARFAAEVDGPAHTDVLTAHLELEEPWRDGALGPILIRLLVRGPRGDVAQRAAVALADSGRPEDFQSLARAFDTAQPEAQIRMLRALGSSGRDEHLSVLSQGLKAKELAVRVAAAEALGGHPSSSAEGLLREAVESPEPEVSRAASQAMVRTRDELRIRNSRGVAPAGGAARMDAILQAARRRLAEERTGSGGPPP